MTKADGIHVEDEGGAGGEDAPAQHGAPGRMSV